jgi:PII-like signaling protein
MDIAKSLDIKGLTTTVGVEGVGRDGRLHSAHFIEMSDQPVEVTMAVTNAQCAALLELLEKNQANIFYVKTAVEFGVVGSPTG